MTTIQLYDAPTCLSLKEVADQLANCGAIELASNETIGDCRLEVGDDLEVDINKVIEDDPRCTGYLVRTETLDMVDIRKHFTAADYYAWGKDENGDDMLYCFGC